MPEPSRLRVLPARCARHSTSVLLLTGSLAALLTAKEAAAAEVAEIGGEPVSLEVTNTGIGAYRFDNRNTQRLNPRTRLDDDYAEMLDRLNILSSWGKLRVGLRLDAGAYASPAASQVRKMAAEDEVKAGQSVSNEYANRYFRELNTRYLNAIYPSKVLVEYATPDWTLTLGDFYAQLGRGMVFSVRKVDELALDTTVRGAKLAGAKSLGEVQLSGMAFAGQMNPLRLDEQTGRRLHGDGSLLFLGFPQAQPFRYVTADPTTNQALTITEPARPSYLEDTVYGGRIEIGPSAIKLGGNASLLQRKSYTTENLTCMAACSASDTQCANRCGAAHPDFSSNNASRQHNQIRTFSGSVTLPSVADHGDAYVEVAGQQLKEGHVLSLDTDGAAKERVEDLSGWAAYANANFRQGPFTFSAEGKRYQKFQPLSGNVDIVTPGFSGPEFDIISYNQVPTAEPIFVQQIGQPNVCMTGGRGRTDVKLSKGAIAYAWVGRYVSYSEIDATNVRCKETPELRTHTWDVAVGSQLTFEEGRSHMYWWTGGRVTDRDVPAEVPSDPNGADPTYAFYREGYVRYDLIKHLKGPFSLQMQGFHRHRYQPPESGKPWNEGENYTALQWSPHLSAVFGYEYLARHGCASAGPGEPEQSFCSYFNGGAQWRSANTDTELGRLLNMVNVFVGQRRGAIRCVSGVCRQFPPFEGARLEVVSRF